MRLPPGLCFALGYRYPRMVGIALAKQNWSIRPVSRAEFLEDWTMRLQPAEIGSSTSARGPPVFFRNRRNCGALSKTPRCCTWWRTALGFLATSASSPSPKVYFRVSSGHRIWFGRMVDPRCRFERPPNKSIRRASKITTVGFCTRWLRASSHCRRRTGRDMFSPDKYRTGGATHQLFALYLYRIHNGTTPDLDRLIRRISARIASEASIDFRVTDLYLQRIAFLLAAGQPDLVKRRWVERALAAQQPNGGWLWSWYGWHPKPFVFGLRKRVPPATRPCNACGSPIC